MGQGPETRGQRSVERQEDNYPGDRGCTLKEEHRDFWKDFAKTTGQRSQTSHEKA